MIKILGHHYQIVEDKDVDSIGAAARVHPKTQVIQIARDLHREGKETAVLHEIIETLDYRLQLELDHRIIMALEAGLYQTLTGAGMSFAPLLAKIEK